MCDGVICVQFLAGIDCILRQKTHRLERDAMREAVLTVALSRSDAAYLAQLWAEGESKAGTRTRMQGLPAY